MQCKIETSEVKPTTRKSEIFRQKIRVKISSSSSLFSDPKMRKLVVPESPKPEKRGVNWKIFQTSNPHFQSPPRPKQRGGFGLTKLFSFQMSLFFLIGDLLSNVLPPLELLHGQTLCLSSSPKVFCLCQDLRTTPNLVIGGSERFRTITPPPPYCPSPYSLWASADGGLFWLGQ